MKRIIQILIAVTFIALLSEKNTQTALAYERVAGASAKLKLHVFGQHTNRSEERIVILRNYLEQFNSPLAKDADAFISTSEKHNLDWTFLPAIAGAESTFGRRVPGSSFNPFGWANGTYKFESWEHAIKTVGEALRRKYINRWGVTTVEQIAPIYAPPSKTWARNVRFYMSDIKNFEKNRSHLALNLSL